MNGCDLLLCDLQAVIKCKYRFEYLEENESIGKRKLITAIHHRKLLLPLVGFCCGALRNDIGYDV
jgi:hypothetical protein